MLIQLIILFRVLKKEKMIWLYLLPVLFGEPSTDGLGCWCKKGQCSLRQPIGWLSQ